MNLARLRRLPGRSTLRRLGAVFSAPARDVRRSSVRVALVATAVVLVAYVVIAGAVMTIVNHNLVAAVDNRLTTYLSNNMTGTSQPPVPGSFRGAGPAYQEPLLLWVVLPDGGVGQVVGRDVFNADGSNGTTPLPASAQSTSSPATATLSSGDELRVAGAAANLTIRLPDGSVVTVNRVVAGQSLDYVTATQHNILTAELLIGPVLLLAVFFGARIVGRRVGAPIERARQQQIALTADASHELRTPLSVIEAQTSLALERERDTTWYRNAFAAVGVESKRMRRLVDDLLWLARFDSTGPTPSSEATDLGVLAELAAQRFTAVAEARGLTLRVDVEPVSTMISAPPEWLDRLLGVLLDNACRYTPPGGTVDVVVGRRDGRVHLAVDDSGPGIPAGERDHIFDRFRRASDAPGGSGLGLAIAAAVVGASGGRWEVGTSPAGGASMAVNWTPLIRGSAQTEETATAPGQPGPAGALAPPPPPQPA
ncbi:MAG TPA: HAMP domain-containing sensor histidine kinase [Candidatus Deferrimicrobium sp.]|nr:HAMP domain-containing sensor histidine kinase [Candidatus Deferrimicrobium sp.]